MEEKEIRKYTQRVSIVSLVINLVLGISKCIVGVLFHSTVLISDGIHSFSDFCSTVIVWVAVFASLKKSDKEHPYGHERIECVAAIILAFLLFLAGAQVGITVLKQFLSGVPSTMLYSNNTLIVVIISIFANEWLYYYTMQVANKTNLVSLKVDAYHHRSDSLSSVVALIGVVGVRFGYMYFDTIASGIVCFYIIESAVMIFKDAIDKMLDTTCDEQLLNNMQEVINEYVSQDNYTVKTRMFGSKVYVEIQITFSGETRLANAGMVGKCIHDCIENKFTEVKHCVIEFIPI